VASGLWRYLGCQISAAGREPYLEISRGYDVRERRHSVTCPPWNDRRTLIGYGQSGLAVSDNLLSCNRHRWLKDSRSAQPFRSGDIQTRRLVPHSHPRPDGRNWSKHLQETAGRLSPHGRGCEERSDKRPGKSTHAGRQVDGSAGALQRLRGWNGGDPCDIDGMAGKALCFLIVGGAPRAAEVFKMRCVEIDDDLWHVPANRMKGRTARDIPLPQEAMDILRPILADNPAPDAYV
jgi:hypothetical protein